MEAREPPEKALESLDGPVPAESLLVHIYVEWVAPGSVRTKSADAGICYGAGSPLNIGLKVPGPGKPTADRGRLYGIHAPLERTDIDKTLVIFCTSKMIIHQLCYSAAKMSLG
jgi:hypothetical protein